MSKQRVDIVVAGHVCLDVIPRFAGGSKPGFEPGSLARVGPAMYATGGAVANVGVALHRLGMRVRLLGKVGDDVFGDAILRILRGHGGKLAEGMLRIKGEVSSYSIVVSPPNRDRFFLHCPGANDTYSGRDVADGQLAGARVLHFGYPPLMRKMQANDGREMAELLKRARRLGLATSLDMSAVDANSPAGAVDWKRWMANVLRHVDVFVPSYDEIARMLGESAGKPSKSRLGEIGSRLIDWGAAVVMLKLGERGLYIRTSGDANRIGQVGSGLLDRARWTDVRCHQPCFKVKVAGTTGSGDCTIAGLLAGIVRGQSAIEAAKSAAAVGACSVESLDSCSGVRTWQDTQKRIAHGWLQHGGIR